MNRIVGFTVIGFSFVLSAATPYVGIAFSNGGLRLNGANAAGNATLFSGAIVETSSTGSQVRLQDGSILFLAPQTRGQVFANRTLIERGSARLDTSRAYQLEALSLRVSAGPRHTSGTVSVHGSTVDVSAREGSMLVSNARGVLVASVMQSQGRSFTAADATQGSTVSGLLTKTSGAYRLTDEISNANVELRGADLASSVGQRVRVSGASLAGARTSAGISEVIQVASLSPLAAQAAQNAIGTALNIIVVEGEGAINNVRERVAREAIVRVEDENHRPVSGASVSFLLPDSGPSGTFADGSRLFSAFTDQQGQAVVRFQPNDQTGPFRIKVDASSQGRSNTAYIGETNSLTGAAAVAAGSIMGLSKGAAVIGGIVIAGGAIATAAVLIENGASTPSQAISPGR